MKTTEKTTTKKINTANAKSKYFIIDSFIYETDLKTITRKEQLSEILNLDELKNKLLSSPILKQIQMYIKDDFKITDIKETTENFNTRTVKIENIREKIIYKAESLQVVKISLKNNAGGSSCLTAKYEPIPAQLLELVNRPELAKSINLIKATCFMSKYADLRNYDKIINKKASSAKYQFLANIYGLNFYIGNDFNIDEYGDKKSGSSSLFCQIENNFYYLTSNLGNESENKKAIEKIGLQQINDFLKKHYDIEIIKTEQSTETTEKPLQNNLPVHITTERGKPLKTVSNMASNKTFLISHKPTLQLEYKQALSLPTPNNIVKTINCNGYKLIKSQSTPAAAEQIELADYTEIPMEGDLNYCGGLDNFYELYYARLKEKKH